jgi:hypothetical protein
MNNMAIITIFIGGSRQVIPELDTYPFRTHFLHPEMAVLPNSVEFV